MTLKIAKNGQRIFQLTCACGAHDPGNTITFPENHGRESDEALEAELKAEYSHVCDDCCCKDKICDKHALRDTRGYIIEPRTSVHPDSKYHHV